MLGIFDVLLLLKADGQFLLNLSTQWVKGYFLECKVNFIKLLYPLAQVRYNGLSGFTNDFRFTNVSSF
jgi:hypothetical protein